MKKYINILIEENQMESKSETLMNLIKGMEFTVTLDTGRLTRKEQEVLNIVGQTQLINLYCEAIKTLS